MLKTHNTQVAVKIETTEGTKIAQTAADVILTGPPKFTPAQEQTERNATSATMSPFATIPGSRQATISFPIELMGAAAAGTAPHYSAALRACGVSETIVGATSVTYKPLTNDVTPATVSIYEDGKIKRIWGARGSAVINADSGKPATAELIFTGADWEEVDGALLTGVTYPTILPPVFMGITFTIDTYAAVIKALGLDLGNEIALRPSAAAASGFLSAIITGRKPMLTFDPEEVLAATKDFFAAWRSGSLLAMSAAWGSVAGNRLALTGPKVQYQKIDSAEREKISTLGIQGLCTRNAGDDEWQLQIT